MMDLHTFNTADGFQQERMLRAAYEQAMRYVAEGGQLPEPMLALPHERPTLPVVSDREKAKAAMARAAADLGFGEEGQGFYGLMRTFDVSRVVLGAAALGTARAAFEYARDYAQERTQFGTKIIDHQAVAFRLADMSSRIDAAWLQVLNAARMLDAGDAVDRQKMTSTAAMAKLGASETAMFCTWAAVQTLGGWGYSREFPVEQWMRDAKLEEIEEGTSDIMRLIIARSL